VPDSPDLAAALLAADPAQREQLMRDADPAMLEVALGHLGRSREPAAAEVLDLVDRVVDDRVLKKAARRELHRLRSSGVHVPPALIAPAEPAPGRSEPTLDVAQAWATDIDPSGSRALWLLAERPLGGVWFGAMLVNDQRGLLEVNLVDTTRKRFRRDFEANQGDAGIWIELPGQYARALVREAVDLSHETEHSLPVRYRAFRDVFGEAASGPERALVYDTISPVEANFNPDWLDDSQRLLGEPEIAGWYVAMPDALRTRTLEVARMPLATLLVPGHTPDQEALHLLAEAARLALVPAVRRALRRRLEETGYVFVATERLNAARLAVAAARGLDEAANVPPERQPLVRVLLAAGLARLITGETVGGRRAADTLIELIEHASTERESGQSGGSIETRPSGLIVPR